MPTGALRHGSIIFPLATGGGEGSGVEDWSGLIFKQVKLSTDLSKI